jgi:hypothetical protein
MPLMLLLGLKQASAWAALGQQDARTHSMQR